jgi:alkanesulfonate monooxygenase SsuD/methylene tetrahydromethanopterin reductase-like flavin-dependent oxidoreductase (luciferase family)
MFGYDLKDYDELFEEKLDLLLKLRAGERVTWKGTKRAPLDDIGVYPRPVQDPLPIWIAVGGSPESVVRAATFGLPLAIAIIGGEPRRFVPFVDLYREAARRSGRDPKSLAVSINSHGFVADTSAQAADEYFAGYSYMMNKIGRERGWPPQTREHFDAERGPLGAILVGDPEEVAKKIIYEHELFGNQRFLLQMSVGTMPHDKVLHAIELFGTKVAPIVRAEIGRRAAA